MTSEEHIERAEWLLALVTLPGDEATAKENELRVSLANTHVAIAFYKKQYPPESGRPIPKAGYQPESGLPVPTPGASYAEPCE